MFATGFGAGYSPFAPGTFGSLVGVAGFLLLKGISPVSYIVVVFLLVLAGIPICGAAESVFGEKDSQKIVIDEIAGQMLTLFAIVAAGGVEADSARLGFSVAAGFVLFRIFDIWKPYPVKNFEKLAGGAGVMLDDVAAGMYALVLLYIVMVIV
jgi:phosphatidylglycerophosphatase A